MDPLEILQEKLKRLRALGAGISAMESFSATDLAPAGANIAIGGIGGVLQAMHHEMLVSDELLDLVEDISAQELLEEPWNRIVDALKAEIEFQKPVPSKLVEQIETHAAQASQSWARAREIADFEIFAPDLGKMIELQREWAACYEGVFKTPYDALMAKFDPYLTGEILDPLFKEAGGFLIDLMKRVNEAEQPEMDFLHGKFNHGTQLEVAKILLEDMGLPFSNTILVTATHPMTIGIITGDLVLASTRTSDLLTECLIAGVHEGGHGLMGLFPAYPFSWMGNIVTGSYSVHESSSRFWENHIGRSTGFCSYLLPRLQSRFPLQFRDVDADMLFKALNAVKPGLIRVDADQATYLLHILLRYEIEKAIINGDIEVDEIPGVWNELMKKYLGIVPENHSQGCLQDVHWSVGYFGYFPTYMGGNWLAAMIEEWILKNGVVDREGRFDLQDMEKVLAFLKEYYYRDAPVLTTDEAISRITGRITGGERETIDLEPWKTHQTELVDAIYG